MTDGRTHIRAAIEAARAEGRGVLFPYLTAGIPTIEESIEIFAAMADAGADGFEIGIPYADPLMDGPVIMEAGERALATGITVEAALEVVSGVVERTGKPVLVMTYVNPVLRHGIEEFMAKAAAAGASGVILADLPVDESGPFAEAARSVGLGMVAFAAPTSGMERLGQVAALDPVFVYAVAEVGVTGERREASTRTGALADQIRSISDAPIVFGVGISTPEHAAAAAAAGDGVIVGTAIVRRVMEAPTSEDAIESLTPFVEDLSRAVRGPTNR